METIDKYILHIIFSYVGLSVRAVCKKWYSQYALSVYQRDRICISYVLYCHKKIKFRKYYDYPVDIDYRVQHVSKCGYESHVKKGTDDNTVYYYIGRKYFDTVYKHGSPKHNVTYGGFQWINGAIFDVIKCINVQCKLKYILYSQCGECRANDEDGFYVLFDLAKHLNRFKKI